jgi:hypothetical protein
MPVQAEHRTRCGWQLRGAVETGEEFSYHSRDEHGAVLFTTHHFSYAELRGLLTECGLFSLREWVSKHPCPKRPHCKPTVPLPHDTACVFTPLIQSVITAAEALHKEKEASSRRPAEGPAWFLYAVATKAIEADHMHPGASRDLKL